MFLGLDLGTTNIKALVVNESGKIIGQGAVPVTLRHVADGGVEQDIEEIWRATLSAIRKAGQAVDLRAVKAVGVSSQGGAIQFRAPDGQPIGPVISWFDSRGQRYDTELTGRLGENWFSSHTGHGASAIVAGQLMRLKETDPAIMAWPNCLGFVGDTIVQRLCGRAAHHSSSLSICDLYNPWRRKVEPELLQLFDLREEQLPDLLPAREPAGGLNRTVAAETQLPAGIPISVAVHDQYAAALGCGAIHPGEVMFGAGTAWVLLAITDHLINPVIPAAWVCDHVVPDRWGQLLSLVVGGSAFKWAMDMAGMGEASKERIDDLMASVPPGSDGLSLWPFLDGMGGPCRPLSGTLHGLRLSHGPPHLLRATIEGLCCELARQVGWLERADCPVRRLILCGGAARSRCTPQIVADTTGRPVTCPLETEISAFGAAILARAVWEPHAIMEDLYSSMAGQTRVISPGEASLIYRDIVQSYIEDLA